MASVNTSAKNSHCFDCQPLCSKARTRQENLYIQARARNLMELAFRLTG